MSQDDGTLHAMLSAHLAALHISIFLSHPQARLSQERMTQAMHCHWKSSLHTCPSPTNISLKWSHASSREGRYKRLMAPQDQEFLFCLYSVFHGKLDAYCSQMKLQYSLNVFFFSFSFIFPFLSFNKALKKKIPLIQGCLPTSAQLAKLCAPIIGTGFNTIIVTASSSSIMCTTRCSLASPCLCSALRNVSSSAVLPPTPTAF